MDTQNNCSHDNCGGHKHRHKMRHHSFVGGVWCIGWLFTVGYLHLTFWSGLLALIFWPYYLGVHFG